jgi:hypothetical protein
MKWVIIGTIVFLTGYSIWKFWKERQKMAAEELADKKVTLNDFTELPMLERDYMLRYLQIFAKALAEAVSQRKNNELDEALRTIHDAFSEDREAMALVDLPLDQFLSAVDHKTEFDAQKWAMAAELLFERAEILIRQTKHEEAKINRIKALHLALEVLLTDPETFRLSTNDLVKDLQKVVSLTELPDGTLALLVEFEASLN